MRMKTIIIEDKKQSREYLETLLQDFQQLNYVGYADSVKKGIELIERINPELVFFDIEYRAVIPGIQFLLNEFSMRINIEI